MDERNADRDGIDRSEFVAVRRAELRRLAEQIEEDAASLTVVAERDWFARVSARLRQLARLTLAALALDACGGDGRNEDCPEDWTFSAIESSYVGAPCPPTVVRETIGCRYRDVCGHEVWVAGCEVDGWLCPDETVRMPAPGAPRVRPMP